MLAEFEIQRSTRRCFATDRELRPGETFFSLLDVQGGDVVRRDYCSEAWPGPPDQALGWWKSKVPDANHKKPQLAPNDVILNYFLQLDGRADKLDVRYVLALLMIRRRIFRLEDSVKDDRGNESLVLYCFRNETEHRTQVTVPESPARIAEIQNELASLLFADAS